ncbi:hypothetical protein QR680_014798 [Steinernema hermaphroditum]|uniref:Glycogen debranching enzyme n=1 Tax=Steinernema hermaphroditum TaxID=289476 RepID=A0AA39IA38_9BILA|nr:hypothetical protein QR680_014798 [Steinernema hermaphroditum]
MHEVRIVDLNRGQNRDSDVLALQKGDTVRFVAGASLIGADIVVKTSVGDGVLDAKKNDAAMDIVCSESGPIFYEFFVNGAVERSGSGYLQVAPQLTAGGKSLPLNAIACQTYLAKLLGTFDEWEDKLRVAKECGYNMVHLTPVQKLGVSNSSYSIADYHSLNNADTSIDDVARLVQKMDSEWGVLSVQDVVWNHAAKNSEWLLQHPECGYNCDNSRHLRPAFVVDRLLQHFSRDIAAGKWVHEGLPAEISEGKHIEALRRILHDVVYPSVRLCEFFQADVDALAAEFEKICRQGPSAQTEDALVPLIQDPDYKRFGSMVDMQLASKVFNRHRDGAWSEDDRVNKCVSAFRGHLQYLNGEAGKKAWEHCSAGINAIIGHVTYERVAAHGPRRQKLTDTYPLVTAYFLFERHSDSWEDDEKLGYSDEGKRFVAFNGWVMNDDPLKNFALPPSQVYLRRELVCWGDCVKLNYGNGPEDNPYLWKYMEDYTTTVAKAFHGIRIDNCHSTPIHLAEHMLKAARKIRPELYVVAELFTGSEQLDHMFVNRLGISSLIREAQNAHDCHEQGRLVYRFGGETVGSMVQKRTRVLTPNVAHALFFDQTHDNPSPFTKRTIYDYVPCSAIVSMASCGIGSTRGYDGFVPYAINVVHETKLYRSWTDCGKLDSGMFAARLLFNKLHSHLAHDGFSQVFVDQVNPEVVAITRHNPTTHDTVLLIAHSCFDHYHDDCKARHVSFSGHLDEILFEVSVMKIDTTGRQVSVSEHIRGTREYGVNVREKVDVDSSALVKIHGRENGHIELRNFPSGSVVAFRISPVPVVKDAIQRLRKAIDEDKEKTVSDLRTSLKDADLEIFNYILFQCEGEEREAKGTGTYDVPNFGKLVYCGLQGLTPILEKIRLHNDLGHPLCSNIRDGCWLADYIVGRFQKVPELAEFARICHDLFAPLKDISHFLRPKYFEAIFSLVYGVVKEELLARLDSTVVNISRLSKMLSFASVAFLSQVASAKLPGNVGGVSLAAGLPHFATGIWRNWGRDTFIALPGCLLLTGRFDDAKRIILAYGSTVRHGLIPNLLAEGRASRYNCRDASWFWLAAIIRYIQMKPNGHEILNETVVRHYPTDESEFCEDGRKETLAETMLEVIECHFRGIEFRERNAGHAIDEHMKDPGFNVKAYIDKDTGFVFGGNEWNCGTWMDKMGSSDKAGNRGIPATPRDGADVELQGLCLYVVEGLRDLLKDGKFKKDSVSDKNGLTWSWETWALTLRKNFETHFYISEQDQSPMVNRRKILKDTVGSTAKYTDFQLRPNLAITLALVPDIVDVEKAWSVIETTEKVLMGPLGIKTLDPSDWCYNGYYNNDEDSVVKKTAKGWNYHQGPEWVWVAGLFLKAKVEVAWRLKGQKPEIWKNVVVSVMEQFGRYLTFIKDRSPWSSLPELTQAEGEHCPGSCEAQAWSIGCLLEAVVALDKYNKQ